MRALHSPILRAASEADIDWIVEQEAREDFSAFIHRSTAQEHRLGLADTDKHYLIDETAEGARLAYVILAGLDSAGAEAEIELMRMAVARPGGGLGQPILRQIIDLAFGEFGANRLWLDVFDDNPRAIRAYQAVGFHEDRPRKPGIARASGQNGTLIVMGIDRPG